MPSTDPARHFPIGEVSRPGTQPIVVLRTPDIATTTSAPATTLIEISHRLRARDYAIAALLHEHTMLTTDQLTSMLFTNPITCRHRLNILRTIGFVDRFIRRHQPGAPNVVCWVAGPLSARMTALSAGDTPPTPKALRERQDRIYANPALDHLIDTNWFGTRLLGHAREHASTDLLRWWSERTTANMFGQRIHPDGHGVWTDGTRQVGYFLELDRGYEFSGGLCPCRLPDLRVFAGQRPMLERYRPRRVWCKHVGGVSQRWACCRGRIIQDGRCWRRRGSSHAWYPCRGRSWGRCRHPAGDGHPDRPAEVSETAARRWCAVVGLVPRKTLGGLRVGGGRDV